MSDKSPSCIEDLSNELWLDIFNYLDSINLFLAFYGINKRINHLLAPDKLSLSVSNSTEHSHSISQFFKDHDLKEFKQIQHLQLTYMYMTSEELNIVKDLSVVPTLTSLHININTTIETQHYEQLIKDIFCQNCPSLQRLYINGRTLNMKIIDNVYTFDFPFILYIHMETLPFYLAIQILNQCHQLRSFSADLYYENSHNPETMDSDLTSLFRSSTPSLMAMTKLNLRGLSYLNSLWIKLLEYLLPCCPNLHTFILDISCSINPKRLLEADWWTHVFASNNKLKRISLHFYWSTNNPGHEYSLDDEVQRFRSSSFFTQLKVDIKQDSYAEFLRYIDYDLWIKN